MVLFLLLTTFPVHYLHILKFPVLIVPEFLANFHKVLYLHLGCLRCVCLSVCLSEQKANQLCSEWFKWKEIESCSLVRWIIIIIGAVDLALANPKYLLPALCKGIFPFHINSSVLFLGWQKWSPWIIHGLMISFTFRSHLPRRKSLIEFLPPATKWFFLNKDTTRRTTTLTDLAQTTSDRESILWEDPFNLVGN